MNPDECRLLRIFFASSRISGQCCFDLEGEALNATVALCRALDDLGALVDPFELARVHGPSQPRQNDRPVFAQPLGKPLQALDAALRAVRQPLLPGSSPLGGHGSAKRCTYRTAHWLSLIVTAPSCRSGQRLGTRFNSSASMFRVHSARVRGPSCRYPSAFHSVESCT